VQWLPWSTASFARARADDKPVLLSIAAAWCESCHDMDRTTYADPHIAARINDRFVAVRVDADRRPDIAERYNLGGWPTTAFLTADGGVIGGGTYVPLDRMAGVLDRVADAFTSRRVELGAPQQLAPHGTSDVSTDLTALVFDTFDRDNGGFGGAPKFPLTAPLELALETHRAARDPAMVHIVESTLDAMGWGGIYDEVDGGFFRYADTADWRMPHQEKLLDVNAALLRIFVEASEVLQVARYRERAADLLRYLQTWLADQSEGGWGGSQCADRAYYACASDERRSMTAPAVDATMYTGWNAAMVSASLRAAEAFDDVALGEFALRSLERVAVGCYKPAQGVSHYLGGADVVRGLLEDQVAMAAAHLDAHVATGNIVHEMMAQELAHYAIRTMWDEAGGGFFDRTVPDEDERIGFMRDRLKPFVTNCEAARVLNRLAQSPGEHDFGDRASATLAAMAPLAAAQGALAAHYVLAARRLPKP
jgi:uncharacterized protein YyaL (SSP411 family)